MANEWKNVVGLRIFYSVFWGFNMMLSTFLWGLLSNPVLAAPRNLDVAVVLDGDQAQSVDLLNIYRTAFTTVIDQEEYTVRFLEDGIYEGEYDSNTLLNAYRKAQSNSEA